MRRPTPHVTFTPASANDAEALASLRVDAMRDSLERIGRFDPQRARDRFLSGFLPGYTRHILIDCERAGFVVVRPDGDRLLLDHLYITSAWQRRGVGAAVLARVFIEADALGLPLRVGALRGSDANRFYQRHGFVLVDDGEFDLYYLRHAICS